MTNTELIKILDEWKYRGTPIGKVLDAIQQQAEEYHRAELLKLNKSDVIGSVCEHSWFQTTKDYKRAWKCTECKKVVHDKHLR